MYQPSRDNNETSQAGEWAQWDLGLHNVDQCARDLAGSLEEDPLDVFGWTAVAAMSLRSEVLEVIELLARTEPKLNSSLKAVIDGLDLGEVVGLSRETVHDAELPGWLRGLAQAEISGVSRRFEYANRSSSTYLIEVSLVDGHRATARIALEHGESTAVSSFWTAGVALHEAERFYRKRYALSTTKPFRMVNTARGCLNVLEALAVSVTSGQVAADLGAPTAWPRNVAVLLWFLKVWLANEVEAARCFAEVRPFRPGADGHGH